MRAILVYPEFPRSFWTLRQSCELLGRKTLMAPLGLLTLAALLPRHWEIRLADLNTRPLAADDWDWADMVLLSGMIVQRDGMLSLVRQAKDRGKPVVVGGPYATSVPEDFLAAGADFLVLGEGENTVPLWLNALDRGETRGVVRPPDDKPAMTASPVPRYDLLNLDDYILMGVQTSRGCPYNCEFCDIINLFGRRPRYKNPDQVLAELETLYHLGWRREVFICDDNFIGNYTHAQAILEKLVPWMQSHGEPFGFWTQTSTDLGHNLPLIDLLTAANFSHVFIGIESPDSEVLAGNRKYQNLKNPLDQALGNIIANGLTVVPSFIMGFDQETSGAGDRICAFVENNHLTMVMLNLLQALPNTALWDRLQRENRLLGTSTEVSTDMIEACFNFRPTRPAAEIMAEYIRTVDCLYEPEKYLARAYRQILAMRPTRAALAGKSPAAHPGKPNGQGTLWSRRRHLGSLLRLLWRQGVVPGYRGQFWRQLLGVYRQNPSRLQRYLALCGMGENLFQIRAGLLAKTAGRPQESAPN
jgi:radical SAM superfamily enzyme YgiQ (UPF0313 family)